MPAQRILIGKIERFVKKFYTNRLIQGVLVGAVLWIVFYLIVNALEYFSWFSSSVRLALLIVLLVGTAFVVGYYFMVPLVNLLRFRKKMTIEQAALMIGRFFPDIQDKLLNTIQLSNGLASDTSNELLLATIEQRTEQLSPVRFTDAIDLRKNLKYLWGFLGLLAVLVALVVFLPKFAVQPTQRIINYSETFEKPLPFEVTLTLAQAETYQGADVPLSLTVTGTHIPDAFYVKSSLGQQAFHKVSTNEFTYTFKNLYHDLDFQVIGGDYVSKPYSITVHPNPVLLSYQCQVDYPAYIHRQREVFDGKTRLFVPQGSKLAFSFSLRDCDSAFVVKDSVRQVLPMKDQTASYTLTAVSSTVIEFSCRNPWSNQFDPLRFSVDVLPDAYPDIRVESYDENLSTRVYYSGLLADDYGFTKLTFNALIKEPVERKIVFPLAFDRSQTRTSFFYHFDMDSLGILPGQRMEVYFEVWDNDGFHGPKSKRSETFSYYKPSKSALDSVADQTEDDIMDRMASSADEASKLKDDIEKMLQELASKKELDWSDREKMKELLEKQAAMEEEWNRLQEEQQQLSEFMKDHDLANEELLKKQEKINELFDQLIPDELKKMMEEIERLLDEMPRDQMQKLLQDMKKDNSKMQDLLDRNLALLEQLRMEKEINELMDRLDQLGEELQNQNGDDEKTAEEALEEFEKMMQEFDSLHDKNQSLQDPLNLQKDEQLEEDIKNDLNEASDMEQNQGSQTPDDNASDASQKKKEAGQKMKEMANSMMMNMQMGGQEQLAEDARLVRILLENVVRASHQEEELMNTLGKMRVDDPTVSQKIVWQKDLADNFVMVKDSLQAMAMRQPAIRTFVFDELGSIDHQINSALKYMNDLRFHVAVSNQQSALQSMNKLALMLVESLNDIENSMSGSGMPSSKNKPKPGNQSHDMKSMQDLQKQLGEQLKQLQQQMQQQQGQQHGQSQQMSEELARMAAEQEMIRQGMQQMLEEMKANGQVGDDGLNQIIKDMERLEEDIVNKRIANQTLERNRQILSRMLESEKAQQKRDQDEKRKSNEFKGSSFDRQIDELIYEQSLKRNQDFLKHQPVQYQPYYRTRINEYYLKKNTN